MEKIAHQLHESIDSDHDPEDTEHTSSDPDHSDAEGGEPNQHLNESIDKELSEIQSPKASVEGISEAARAHAQGDALRAQVAQGAAQLAQRTQEAQELQRKVDESAEVVRLLQDAAREKEQVIQNMLAQLEDSKQKYLLNFSCLNLLYSKRIYSTIYIYIYIYIYFYI